MSPNAVYHRVSHGRYASAALNMLVWCYAATSQAAEPGSGAPFTPQRSYPSVAQLPAYSVLTYPLGITSVPVLEFCPHTERRESQLYALRRRGRLGSERRTCASMHSSTT